MIQYLPGLFFDYLWSTYRAEAELQDIRNTASTAVIEVKKEQA